MYIYSVHTGVHTCTTCTHTMIQCITCMSLCTVYTYMYMYNVCVQVHVQVHCTFCKRETWLKEVPEAHRLLQLHHRELFDLRVRQR